MNERLGRTQTVHSREVFLARPSSLHFALAVRRYTIIDHLICGAVASGCGETTEPVMPVRARRPLGVLALVLALAAAKQPGPRTQGPDIRRRTEHVAAVPVPTRRPPPTLTTKVCMVASSHISCNLLLRGLARALAGSNVYSPADLDLSSRYVSAAHAVVASVLGLTTAVRERRHKHDDNPSWLGTLALCISLGYFLYDTPILFEVNYDPLYPLLFHHVFSGASLLAIIFRVPKAVWWACLLQFTEAVLPFSTACFLVENANGQGTWVYCMTRWLQLGVWLVVRELLFVFFALEMRREWPRLSPVVRSMGIGGGTLLSLFNTAGLTLVVAKGIPWVPELA